MHHMLFCLTLLMVNSNSNTLDIIPDIQSDCVQVPHIQIKAILGPCISESPTKNIENKNYCRRQIRFSIKMFNNGNINQRCLNEYIVIEHVYNTNTKQKERLMNPYVFRIKRERLYQLYMLKLRHIVNGEAYEEVINSEYKNYNGCDCQSTNPTCGIVTFRNQIVPYSSGFCCSCGNNNFDPNQLYIKYAKRQQNANVQYSNLDQSINSSNQCPVNKKSIRDINTDKFYLPGINSKLNWNNGGRQQFKKNIAPGRCLSRAQQNCLFKPIPPCANPKKYLESTHCLRFSDLWYSVYSIMDPIVEHSMMIQLFTKIDTTGICESEWVDLLDGGVKIGTLKKEYADSMVSIKYTPVTSTRRGPFDLDPEKMLILIPEPVTNSLEARYPEIKGGVGEYLVVSPDNITFNGDECDKIGVSFKAFVTQPNRCCQPPGTCLNNQPAHLWYRDKTAELMGNRGCHFLKYFGTPAANPIRMSSSPEKKYLALEFNGIHFSLIDVKLNADDNSIIRCGHSAKITEVYIDNTCKYRTKIMIKVTNSGYASTWYKVRLTDCPPKLPSSWKYVDTDFKHISPFYQHYFQMDLHGELSLDRFYCSVAVVNKKQQLIAVRKIRVHRWDRCFCIFHCLCTCVGSTRALHCSPLPTKHYHAAGFQGQVPMTTPPCSCGETNETAKDDFLLLSGCIIFFLLLLGLLKAILGLCFPLIGVWGLDKIATHPHQIDDYREKKLRGRTVIHDDTGWPVHPDTYNRTVRVLSLPIEFIINVVFFILYPLAIALNIIWYACCCCCPFHSRNESECFEWVNSVSNPYEFNKQCEKSSLIPKENEYETSRTASTKSMRNQGRCAGGSDYVYSSGVNLSHLSDSSYDNSEQEREDTKYVLNELKKSKMSLNINQTPTAETDALYKCACNRLQY